MTSAIYRDGWGVPHLRADTALELSYLQGRAAARDRAWQIEVERWRSEGRLAERIGAAEVPWDRFARRARLDDTARRSYERLDDETRTWVGAYVDGVNSELPTTDAPEFAALAVRPAPWEPWTPLGIFLVQHILFGTFPTKMWRSHVEATIGTFPRREASDSGSNSWAVAGEYIAGDPHRLLELPGVYHQVRLSCPEFDVAGFAFPGVPGVPHFGHAGQVAWAITNAMADYQDLYIEELRRSGDEVEARGGSGWERVSRHVETIRVRDADDVTVEVIETPRGPVIDRNLSLRVPARVDLEVGFGALLPLLRATTVEDVAAALSCWVEPVNSVVTADSTGALLSFAAGRVPLRDDRNRQVPVPAWDERYRWRGYATMPRSARATVVNANDRRPGDTEDLGYDFAPPTRARRIAALLSRGTPPERVHVDVVVGLGILERLTPGGPAARELHERLLAWDRRMDADSHEAALFAAWRHAAVRRLTPTLAPLLTDTGFDPLFAPWLNPVQRIGQALDQLITEEIAEAALADVAADPPPGPWGATHVLTPLNLVPATALGETVPLSGDSDCVRATRSLPGVTDDCWFGSVARYVWDVAVPDRSRWIVPFGASGRPDSPHFKDQLPRWRDGDLVPVIRDWSALRLEQKW
ncbi:penicillin acylase family protein [Actinoplanes sp. NPDC051633]|uniref:penicillin acylase family protein n=1 Tax=Actinoplanes sp. NPDC051633 TaxID=3155670 RepID=UPI0034408FD9